MFMESILNDNFTVNPYYLLFGSSFSVRFLVLAIQLKGFNYRKCCAAFRHKKLIECEVFIARLTAAPDDC